MSNYARNFANEGGGSPASPASLAAGASVIPAALSIGNGPTGNNQPEGKLRVVLILGGTAPTTPSTVQFQTTVDGANYYTIQTFVSANVAGTTVPYDFVPDVEDQGVQALITCGATTGITYFAQGVTIGGP